MQKTEDYAEYIQTALSLLRKSFADGITPDVAQCVQLLEPGRFENKEVRDFCIKNFKITGKDFDSAMRRVGIVRELGRVPQTPAEFVAIMVDRMNITALYNGQLSKQEQPYVIFDDGIKHYINPNQWDDAVFATIVRTRFHCKINVLDFELDCRCLAANLGLPFSAAQIDDAIRQWHRDARVARIDHIAGETAFADSSIVRQAGQDALKTVAEACFDCTEDRDFIVAVFNKFIWQVKRKIRGMPISNHLMPVILGGQGVGKSTLVERLVSPVAELMAKTDFAQVTDDRNMDLWQHYILFLDEMAKASKTDMDTVKHVITTDVLTRRPMRTNSSVQVSQNATLIGCANEADLASLIRDTTGVRRFAAMRMINANYEVINKVNWFTVWQSVDHKADDPMIPFMAKLKIQQEENRNLSTFEEWIDSLTPGRFSKDQKLESSELFGIFSAHEEEHNPGLRVRTSSAMFGRLMAALVREDKADNLFYVADTKKKQKLYHWRG